MLVVGARRGEWGYIVRHSLGAGKDGCLLQCYN